MNAPCIHGLARLLLDGSKDVRAQQFKELTTSIRNADAPPLADGGRLYLAQAGNFGGAAELIDDLRINSGLVHARMLGVPYIGVNRRTYCFGL